MKGLVGENGQGDVSAALARLNFGIEDLNRQLKGEVRTPPSPLRSRCATTGSRCFTQVTKHHSSLLLQAASLGGLDNDLSEVRRGLAEVEGGVTRCARPSLLASFRTAADLVESHTGSSARSPLLTSPSHPRSCSSLACAAPPRSPAVLSASWSSPDDSRHRWPKSMARRRRLSTRVRGRANDERGPWRRRR